MSGPLIKDRVKETSTTVGTGTFTLLGAAAGYLGFTTVGTGNNCFYTIVHQTLGQWEIGLGTYTSASATLTRLKIYASSNANALVDFSAGTKDVFCDYPAQRMSNPTKIGVLGDSISGQSGLWPEYWPQQLEVHLNTLGADVTVKTFSINGATFYQANNTARFGTKTAKQALIDWNPDVVIVCLGFNDTVGAADGRTVTQIKADALATFTDLRAALPTTVPLIYAAEVCYDQTNFPTPGTTLKNKGIIPGQMTLKSSGILASLYTNEMLDDTVSSATKTNVDAWLQVDTYIRTLTTLIASGTLTLNGFKIYRLGCSSSDDIHPTAFGAAMIAAGFVKQLRSVSEFTAIVQYLADQDIGGNSHHWQDPDQEFSDYLTASGDGFVRAYPAPADGEAIRTAWGWGNSLNPDVWFHPYKSSVQMFFPDNFYNSYLVDGLAQIVSNRADAGEIMYLSIDGGAWVASTTTTDSQGNCTAYFTIASFLLSNASHDFRVKIGTSSYGPFTKTITALENASAHLAYAMWDSQFKVAGSDATTTGQALVDVTGLVTGTLTVSAVYEFEAVLFVSTTAVATGTQYGVNVTVAPTSIFANYQGPTTVAANVQSMLDSGTNANNIASGTFLTTASETGCVVIKGVFKTAGSGSPVFSVRHLKVTSGTSTVAIGSSLKVRRVA